MHGTASPSTAARGTEDKLLFGVPEVAHLLSVSERYVWMLIDTGALGSVKIGNRRLVPTADVHAFIERLKDEARRAREAAAART